MSSKNCKNHVDSFCYICGEIIEVGAKKFSLLSNKTFCKAYEAYFNLPVPSQDKTCTPHFPCNNCKNTLEAWYRGEKNKMKFAVPRLWRVAADHIKDCFINPRKHRTGKNAKRIEYPNLPSTSASVPQSENFLTPSTSQELIPLTEFYSNIKRQ